MDRKKIAAALLAFCLTGAAFPVNISSPAISVFAEDSSETEEDLPTLGNLTYRRHDDHIELVSCEEGRQTLDIPEEIDGLPVTELCVFVWCHFERLTIPGSIKELTLPCFPECSFDLMVLSDGIKKIDKTAFEYTAKFAKITILDKECDIFDDPHTLPSETVLSGYAGSTVQAYAEKYGREFEPLDQPDDSACLIYEKYVDHVEVVGCKNTAKNVIIPEEVDGSPVTAIGRSAFMGCGKLVSVTIPDSVTDIGWNAFAQCFSLKEIVLPKDLRAISHSTFYGCNSLESIAIPEGVSEIGYDAFSYCSNLKSVTIPSSVTGIYDGAFNGCEALEEIVLPDSITNYHLLPGSDYYGEAGLGYIHGVFSGCSSLKSVKLSENASSVAYSDFMNCTSLKEITFPKGVSSIGCYSFIGCDSLEKITILDPECSIDSSAFPVLKDIIVCGYDDSTAQAYAEEKGYTFTSLGTPSALALGDANGDGKVDSSDASVVLGEYSRIQTGGQSQLAPDQKQAADANKDGKIDSSDASEILRFYAYIQTGGEITNMELWQRKRSALDPDPRDRSCVANN